MNKNLVSIIIPTKNSGRTIGRCLASIKQQSYPNIEIIVVDNNSSDKTPKIARKFTDKVFDHGPERSAQRNFGAKKARGVFLLFVDSDMVLSQEVIQESVEKFKNKDVKMITIPEKSFGKGIWSQCKVLERSFYVGIDWMEASRFFERSVFETLKGYDTQNTGTEDYDLPQRVESKFGSKSKDRIDSFIYHDEGKIDLIKLLKKKFYYSRDLANYSQKQANKIKFNKQASLLGRYKLFFANPSVIIKNPFLFILMLVMKTLEFVAGGLGLLSKYFV